MAILKVWLPVFFFFNDTATTEIYTLSLHDALPLSLHERGRKRQLEAISGRLEELASRGLPIIIAGDFNDWRHRATAILERRLGMTEVSGAHHGRALPTFPSMLPLLRLRRTFPPG